MGLPEQGEEYYPTPVPVDISNIQGTITECFAGGFHSALLTGNFSNNANNFKR